MNIYFYEIIIPQISLLVAYTDKGVCYLGALESGEEEMVTAIKKQFPTYQLFKKNLHFDWEVELINYFKGSNELSIPIDIRGTDFQMKVWKELNQIPRGEIRTYKQIAQELGNINAVRAVANAIGANPVCIIIPCHRVIGSNGQLTGYRHGLDMKKLLLEIEENKKNAIQLLTD